MHIRKFFTLSFLYQIVLFIPLYLYGQSNSADTTPDSLSRSNGPIKLVYITDISKDKSESQYLIPTIENLLKKLKNVETDTFYFKNVIYGNRLRGESVVDQYLENIVKYTSTEEETATLSDEGKKLRDSIALEIKKFEELLYIKVNPLESGQIEYQFFKYEKLNLKKEDSENDLDFDPSARMYTNSSSVFIDPTSPLSKQNELILKAIKQVFPKSNVRPIGEINIDLEAFDSKFYVALGDSVDLEAIVIDNDSREELFEYRWREILTDFQTPIFQLKDNNKFQKLIFQEYGCREIGLIVNDGLEDSKVESKLTICCIPKPKIAFRNFIDPIPIENRFDGIDTVTIQNQNSITTFFGFKETLFSVLVNRQMGMFNTYFKKDWIKVKAYKGDSSKQDLEVGLGLETTYQNPNSINRNLSLSTLFLNNYFPVDYSATKNIKMSYLLGASDSELIGKDQNSLESPKTTLIKIVYNLKKPENTKNDSSNIITNNYEIYLLPSFKFPPPLGDYRFDLYAKSRGVKSNPYSVSYFLKKESMFSLEFHPAVNIRESRDSLGIDYFYFAGLNARIIDVGFVNFNYRLGIYSYLTQPTINQEETFGSIGFAHGLKTQIHFNKFFDGIFTIKNRPYIEFYNLSIIDFADDSGFLPRRNKISGWNIIQRLPTIINVGIGLEIGIGMATEREFKNRFLSCTLRLYKTKANFNRKRLNKYSY